MHDCINCGCACYCHGDIDDCPVETIEYAYEHCVGCGCEKEPDAGWPDEPEPLDFDAEESRYIDRQNARAINRRIG